MKIKWSKLESTRVNIINFVGKCWIYKNGCQQNQANIPKRRKNILSTTLLSILLAFFSTLRPTLSQSFYILSLSFIYLFILVIH